MAQTAISTSRFERASHTSGVERVSQSSTDTAREYDDGLDFPPTAHPGRELFTFKPLCPSNNNRCYLGWVEANFVDMSLTAPV